MTFVSVQHGNHNLYMLLAQVCGDALDLNSQPSIFKSFNISHFNYIPLSERQDKNKDRWMEGWRKDKYFRESFIFKVQTNYHRV